MKVLVIYAHPNPGSFNHAVLEAVTEGLNEAGHEVQTKDLYAEGVKTILDAEDFRAIHEGKLPEDIRKEQEDVARADGLVFIYPVWWFSAPAILKGWIDRVFLEGFAYSIWEGGVTGLLKHRKALVVNTTGGDEAGYNGTWAMGLLAKPLTEGVLAFCGVREVFEKTFYGVPYVSREAREEMLRMARELGKAF